MQSAPRHLFFSFYFRALPCTKDSFISWRRLLHWWHADVVPLDFYFFLNLMCFMLGKAWSMEDVSINLWGRWKIPKSSLYSVPGHLMKTKRKRAQCGWGKEGGGPLLQSQSEWGPRGGENYVTGNGQSTTGWPGPPVVPREKTSGGPRAGKTMSPETASWRPDDLVLR